MARTSASGKRRKQRAAEVDPVTFQVIKESLVGIVREMQNCLFRTGFSTIIRESQDASCALLNTAGEVVAQHVVLPLHIGAFPHCTAAVLRDYGDDLAPGDGLPLGLVPSDHCAFPHVVAHLRHHDVGRQGILLVRPSEPLYPTTPDPNLSQPNRQATARYRRLKKGR